MTCVVHTMVKISKKYRPYRYICIRCMDLLKIANGVHVKDAEWLERLTK